MSRSKTIMVTINVSHANNPFNLWQSPNQKGVKPYNGAVFLHIFDSVTTFKSSNNYVF